MTPEERADRLARIAQELVVRVRDDDPDVVHQWLESAVAGEWLALSVILACAVPDDRSWRQLTAWISEPPRERRGVQPCGTRAAYYRHHVKGEVPCKPCLDAKRKYEREHKRGQHATTSPSRSKVSA